LVQQNNNLIVNLNKIVDYSSNSFKRLERGLYLSYIKIESSLDQARIMISKQCSNMLPFLKLRDNPAVSHNEWTFLKSIGNNSNSNSNNNNNIKYTESNLNFLSSLLKGIEYFVNIDLNINNDNESTCPELNQLRLITSNLIELNSDITLILLYPPVSQTVSITTQCSQETILNLNDQSKNNKSTKRKKSSKSNKDPVRNEHKDRRSSLFTLQTTTSIPAIDTSQIQNKTKSESVTTTIKTIFKPTLLTLTVIFIVECGIEK
jgi:hypothetical protein